MRKISVLLLLLLSWLQYSLWLGKNGVYDLVRIENDLMLQQSSNSKLKARNNQLSSEIEDLNGGQEAIEELSRNELGMIKAGEIFFRLVPGELKQSLVIPMAQDAQQ